jgi:hypothetical protein
MGLALRPRDTDRKWLSGLDIRIARDFSLDTSSLSLDLGCNTDFDGRILH